MSWLGTGLKLEEFLKMNHSTRRARFHELSDVHQHWFVERHLDSLEAILVGYPHEDMLPETQPPEFPYHEEEDYPEDDSAEIIPIRRAMVEEQT